MKNRIAGCIHPIMTLACFSVALLFLTACEQEYRFDRLPMVRFAALQPDVPGPGASPLPFQERVLKMDASVKTETPAVKMVLIVDNSPSMGSKQLVLANGVTALAKQLWEFNRYNIDFYIYTTTLSPDAAKPKSTILESVSYQYRDSQGNLETSSIMPTGNPAQLTLVKENELVKPYNIGTLQIRPGMTEAAFESLRVGLTNSISSLGTNGSGSEAGLMSLAFILAETGPNRVVGPGDKVAFVILTDDDEHFPNFPKRELLPLNYSGEIRTVGLVEALGQETGTNLGVAVHRKLQSLFGNDGFYVSEMIPQGIPDMSGCTSEIYVATNYLNFAEVLGSRGSVQPICSPAYSMENIGAFIKTTADNSYVTVLGSNEWIAEVYRVRGGEKVQIMGSEVNIAGGTVTFANGVLLPGDSIELKILSP